MLVPRCKVVEGTERGTVAGVAGRRELVSVLVKGLRNSAGADIVAEGIGLAVSNSVARGMEAGFAGHAPASGRRSWVEEGSLAGHRELGCVKENVLRSLAVEDRQNSDYEGVEVGHLRSNRCLTWRLFDVGFVGS